MITPQEIIQLGDSLTGSPEHPFRVSAMSLYQRGLAMLAEQEN